MCSSMGTKETISIVIVVMDFVSTNQSWAILTARLVKVLLIVTKS